jgi:hypothetical protein
MNAMQMIPSWRSARLSLAETPLESNVDPNPLVADISLLAMTVVTGSLLEYGQNLPKR